MIIYATELRLRNTGGVGPIHEIASRWLFRKSGESITSSLLSESHDFRLRDGSQLQSWTEPSEVPRLYALRLTHGDRDVAGRMWITELGVEDTDAEFDLRVTVLLETSEISARVLSPVQVTRPLLVESLLLECTPAADTPGIRVKVLTPESARAFGFLVTDQRRTHPLIVISAMPSGEFLVDIERLRSLVAGLADVVQIPSNADTFALADILGKEHAAWNGAVNVLFAPRVRAAERFVPRTRLLPVHLAEIRAEGRSVESELLSIVAHRMNVPNSRRHVRPEAVREVALRREILRRRREAEQVGSTAELLPLYEEADRESKLKIQQLEDWNRDLEGIVDSLEDEKRSLAFQNEGLKAALGSSRSGTTPSEGPRSLEALLAVIDGNPSLEQSLEVIEFLFPNRVVILDSAWKAARDAKGFANRAKAFGLIKTLATSYWQDLSDGKGDNEARRVFGSAYSARESESVESNRKARSIRTFVYEGKPIEMWRHLKIGVKPSLTETLRIHFEWDGAKKRIVIGHCGKHLDHR